MGPHGYPVQGSAPPSLVQLQRHLMSPGVAEADRDNQLSSVAIGDPEASPVPVDLSVKKSVSNNTLSSRNLSLHDGAVGLSTEGLDLDQTTMIGSALDLDSLEADRGLGTERERGGSASNNGSQVGLLKLSTV